MATPGLQSRTLRAAAVAAMALLLAACAAKAPIKPYVAPTSGDTAKLLVRPVIGTGFAFGVFAYEDAHTCHQPRRVVVGAGGSANNSGSSSANNSANASRNSSHILRAGPLSTLEIVGTDRSRSCRLTLSFYPKPRHTYLLAAGFDNSGCTVRLFDATDGDKPVPEKSLARRTRTAAGCAAPGGSAETAMSGSYLEKTNPGAKKAGDGLDDLKDLLPAD